MSNKINSNAEDYRPEIDGLRAVAVVSVVLFHLDLPYLPGGLLGVDVFFVISGYLITRILLNSIKNGSFSIAGFYERRARRILPALAVMLIFTSVAAYIILNAADYRVYNRSLSSVALFISNFFFFENTHGYFAANARQMPLLHTWSLSVEEQFYVLYPLLLFSISRFAAQRYVKPVLLLLFIGSLTGCCIIGMKDGNEVFYNSLYRCWELLAGGLLAAGILPVVKNRRVGSLMSFLGVALLGFSFYCFGTIPYNFIFSITSIASAFLILYSLQATKNAVGSLLGSRALVYIGKCSYSLYLWHWPVIVFTGLLTLNELSFSHKLVVGSVSFLLSVLSYHFIEQPFRKPNAVLRKRRIVLSTAAVLLVIMGLTGVLMNKYSNLSNRSETDRLLADASDDRFWLELVKNQGRFEKDSAVHPFSIGDQNEPASFIVWGDSHAHVLASGIDSLNKTTYNRHGYLLSLPATAPLLGVEYFPPGKLRGSVFNSRIFGYIKQHPEIKTIVLHARWMHYFLKRRQLPVITDSAVTNFAGMDKEAGAGLPSKRIFCASLRFTIDQLRKLDKKVVIVTPTPETPYTFNKLTIHARFYDADLNAYGGSIAHFEKYNRELMSFFGSLQSDDVRVLHADQAFRNGNRFFILKNNHLLYRDGDHLSRYGAIEVAKGLQGMIE